MKKVFLILFFIVICIFQIHSGKTIQNFLAYPLDRSNEYIRVTLMSNKGITRDGSNYVVPGSYSIQVEKKEKSGGYGWEITVLIYNKDNNQLLKNINMKGYWENGIETYNVSSSYKNIHIKTIVRAYQVIWFTEEEYSSWTNDTFNITQYNGNPVLTLETPSYHDDNKWYDSTDVLYKFKGYDNVIGLYNPNWDIDWSILPRPVIDVSLPDITQAWNYPTNLGVDFTVNTDTLEFKPIEGKTAIPISVYNSFGNETNKTITVKCDLSPPDPVNAVYAYPKFIVSQVNHYGKTTYDLDGINIDYDFSGKDNPQPDNCGIKSYGISVAEKNSINLVNKEIESTVSGSGTSNNFYSLSDPDLYLNRYDSNTNAANEYKVGVIVYDNLLHKSDWECSNLIMPPPPVKFSGNNPVKYLKPYLDNGVVKYPIEITVDCDMQKYQNEIDGLKIYYVDKSNPTSNTLLLLGEPDENSSNQLVFNTVLEGSQHAHKEYLYFITTLHKSYLHEGSGELLNNNIEEFGEEYDGVDTVNPDKKFRVPNFEDDFNLIVTKENGDEILINKNGYIGSSEIKIETQEDLTFSLDKWTDAEGDLYKIELMTINNNTLSEMEKYGENNIPPLSLVNENDINLYQHCYLVVYEYYIDENGEEQPLTSIYDDIDDYKEYDSQAYKNRKTRHLDSQGLWEGFIIHWDFIAPYGLFHLVSRDSENDDNNFTTLDPANSEMISIFISEDNINQMNSDNVSEITFFNVDASFFYKPYEIQDADIEAEYLKIDASYIKTYSTPLPDDGEGNYYLDNNWFSHWDLTLGIDQSRIDETNLRIVGMRLVNGAGTVSYKYQIIKIDKTVPSAPNEITHTHNLNEKTIAVQWNDTNILDTDVRYVICYEDYSGKPITIYNDIGESAILIDISGFDSDTPINFTLHAEDRAKNQSEGVTFTIYTPAYIGNYNVVDLQNITEQGYDVSYGKHYLDWVLPDAKASILKVKYKLSDSEGVMEEAELIYQGDNRYRLSGLSSRSEYILQLAAYNGDIPPFSVVTEEFNFKLQNNNPSAVNILGPREGFTEKDFTFSWNNSIDPESDLVIYVLNIRDSANNTFNLELTNQTGNVITYNSADITSFSFDDGISYEWWVSVRDNYNVNEYADSEHYTFTVDDDTRQPVDVISFELPESRILDKNVNFVKTNILPSTSGITKIEYWTSDVNSKTTVSESSWINNFNGSVSIDIPVTETGNVSVSVFTGTGREISLTCEKFYIDKTVPVITAADIKDLYREGNYCYSPINKIPIQISCSENIGINKIEYSVLNEVPDDLSDITVWSSLSGFKGSNIDYDGNIDDYLIFYEDFIINGVDGDINYLAIRAIDWAENVSDVFLMTHQVVVDTTPPEFNYFIDSPFKYNLKYYFTSAGIVHNYSPNDPHSGIKSENLYFVIDGNFEETRQWDPNDFYTSGLLTDGASFQFYLDVINKAGIPIRKFSNTVVYDSSAPSNLSLTYNSTKEYSRGEILKINVSAEEFHSAIKEYKIAIGTKANPTYVSSLISGNVDGYLLKDGGTGGEFIFKLPSNIESGTYYIIFEATNTVDKNAVLDNNDNVIVINNNQERVVVWDVGPYQSNNNTINGSIRYIGSREISGYEYRIIGLDTNPEWVSVNNTSHDISISVNDLNMSDGTIYYIEACAVYSDGTRSEEIRSEGVFVDTKDPVINSISTPIACKADGIKINWDVNDEHSGLNKIEVLLETRNEDNSVSVVGDGWITVSTVPIGNNIKILSNNNGNIFNLKNNQKIYLTLRVTDKAGLSEAHVSPVIIIDTEAPPLPIVMDQGDYINTSQGLEASWLCIGDDKESGIMKYEWTVVDNYSQINNALWHEYEGALNNILQIKLEDFEDEIGFMRSNGEKWYFAVKSVDRAGNESVGISNGITYDSEGPFISDVKLLNGNKAEDETQYINSTENLAVNISAHDEVSNIIIGYNSVYGTWNELGAWIGNNDVYTSSGVLNSIISLSNPNPSLEIGKVSCFRGECLDVAGNASSYGYSKGVVYDPNGAVISNVFSLGGLSFDWDIVSLYSPILEYEYELVNLNNNITVDTGVTIYRNVVIDQTYIEDGQYRLNVRARNISGNYSEWKGSNIVYVDRTGPEIISFQYDKYVSSKLSFSIEAQDDLSGVSGYEYMLGTEQDSDFYSNGWKDCVLNSENKKVIDLTDVMEIPQGINTFINNTHIILSVRAKDNTNPGELSNIHVSDPITVDLTRPSIPIVSCNDYTLFNTMIQGLNIESIDDESGLANYRFTVIEEGSSISNAQWQEVSVSESEGLNNITLNGLNLTDNNTYQIVIETQNHAGLWSEEPGYSNTFYVDSIEPGLTFLNKDETMVYNINDTFVIPFAVSEDVSVTFYLESVETAIVTEIKETDANNDDIVYAMGEHIFRYENNINYGEYELSAVVVDKLGNTIELSSDMIQKIRVNREHTIVHVQNEFYTTPGAGVVLSVKIENVEAGDGPFTFSWSDGINSSILETPTFIYEHEEITNQETRYEVNVTVTDNNGLSVDAVVTVVVRNTQEGALNKNEYWSGTHYIKGDVIIPDGVTLTVAADTNVVIIEGSNENYDHKISVNGSLITNNNAVFRMEDNNIAIWQGIYVDNDSTINNNTAGFNNIEIRDAERSITIISGSNAIIDGCRFIDNVVGIHIPGVNQEIINCLFKNNLYGIKEEIGDIPIIKSCTFEDNHIDYYDQDKTSLTIDEINYKREENENNKGVN